MIWNVIRHLFSVREWFLLHLLLIYVFIASGILINLLQLLLLITLRPLSLSIYRKANITLAWLHWSQLIFLSEWWSGSECTVVYEKGTDIDEIGHEHGMVIMNHKYDIDWLMGWMVAEHFRVLGATKVYAKNSLKFVPLIGSTWWFTESIFLKRNYDSDRRTMEKSHEALQTYPSPFWILLFCEGTRFTQVKHQQSMEVARKKGLPELKHHLLPRPKGFCMAINGFKDKITSIYDTTICVSPSDVAPTLKNILYGRRCVAELFVRRIPVADVPRGDDEKTGHWLNTLYQEKDAMFSNFLHHGSFLPAGDDDRLERVRIPRRPNSLVNFIFWTALTVPPLAQWVASVLLSGDPWVISGLSIVVLILYIGRRILLGITQIEKGSSFGLKATNPATPNGDSPTTSKGDNPATLNLPKKLS